MTALVRWSLWCFLGLAVLAPLIATERPLVADPGDGSGLVFPAFSAAIGGPTPPPEGFRSWRDWWHTLPEEGEAWALMAPWDVGPEESFAGRIAAGPSTAHPLGNDGSGRDLLARMIHGAHTAVLVAGVGVVFAAALGVTLGLLAGFYGGLVDLMVLRVIEVAMCFPLIFLTMAAGALFGGTVLTLSLCISLVYWESFARIVRGEMLSLREREFVVTARGLGISGPRILFRHILPCLWGPIRATGLLIAANAIILEASLSFMGLGSGFRSASWGGALLDGREAFASGAWHLILFPSVALVAVVLGLHYQADSVRRPAAQ